MSTFPPKDSDPLDYYVRLPYWTHFAERERELNNQQQEDPSIRAVVNEMLEKAQEEEDNTSLLAILRERRAEMEMRRDTLNRIIKASTLLIDYLDSAP